MATPATPVSAIGHGTMTAPAATAWRVAPSPVAAVSLATWAPWSGSPEPIQSGTIHSAATPATTAAEKPGAIVPRRHWMAP
jgi:hypothetical protein